jgi:integrase/ribosomal protein L40E
MAENDFYNRKQRVESIKRKFKQECSNCYTLLEKFEHALKLNNYSIGRIEKYWCFLRKIHELFGKCFDAVEKKDVEDLIIKIDQNSKWSEWTKNDFKRIVKFFYRWLKYGNLEGDYPDLVKWIKVKMKRNNERTPEQILTKEEIELMASKAVNLRDKALVLILYESGCRVGELLNMKIKDVAFDSYGCYILVSGKTGWRRIRIIEYSKDLLAWLDSHPFKTNPESYIWINLERPNPQAVIRPESINNLLKELAKKANVSKKVHPHAFRHARATHLAKHLTEALMKEHFGWTKDSKMAAVYIHLSGKDLDEALLKIHGIKQEETKQESPKIKICPRCGEPNSILTHFCKKCNAPLDLKVMLELEDQRKQLDEFLKDFLLFYSQQDPKFKKAFVRFVKEKRAEGLFGVGNDKH